MIEVKEKILNLNSIEIENIDRRDYPDFVDAFVIKAEWEDGTNLTESELEEIDSKVINELIFSNQLWL